jgi:hypothetical protein
MTTGVDSVRVLIGNDFSEEVRSDRGWTSWWVQRLIWFAADGDILVLPDPPDRSFFKYVAELTGLDLDTITMVIPDGAGSGGMLTFDRLVSEKLVREIAVATAGRPIERILPLWPDVAVARLAAMMGVPSALPAGGFLAQSGGVLMNSKSTFRTVAAGVGVPIPAGAVCAGPHAAAEVAADLLRTGTAVITKNDWMSGGRGNEILTTQDGLQPIGARRAVRVADAGEIAGYFSERWPWLSNDGRGLAVVERYFEDSSAYFAEFEVTDDASILRGTGELLSAPYAVGQVMPPQDLSADLLDELAGHAHRLCEAARAMGYRGMLCADAIVTPERDVMFTEWNGRVTGSTHIYERIGKAVIGAGYGTDRMILERVWPRGWLVGSFADARRRLGESGLAYDPASRTGVVFTNAFDGQGVMYCVAAPDADTAWSVDRQLDAVFTSARQ